MFKKIFIKSFFKFIITLVFSFFVCVGIFNLSTMYLKKVIYPLNYKEYVFKYADYYGLDRALIFSIIKTESSFDKNAISSAGAVGLMQITESTALYIAQKLGENNYKLTEPETNIRFGCYYVKYLYQRFENLETALVAYNAGEGNVANWLKDENLTDDGITLKKIPFKESREYILKIKQNVKKYKKLYNKILDK